MSGLVHDLVEAFVRLGRRPIQSLGLGLVLVIGLSAATSAFGYIHAFSQPFPGVDSKRLVRIFEMDGQDGYLDPSFLDYLDYGNAKAIDRLAVAQPYYAASVRLETTTEVAFIEAVTGNLFSMLGVEVVHGRGFRVEDDQLRAQPVAVISHDWWQTLFGADPGAVGATIYLNYRPFTVVGVVSPAFRGTAADARPDVWIPIAHFRDRYVSWDQAANDRNAPLARAFGRLSTGVSWDQAEAELVGIAAGLDENYRREDATRVVRLEQATWIDPRTRQSESGTLHMMVIAAGGLLLLVCANVANLLIAASVRRRKEAAVRAAIGASPMRLVRQDLMENVVLALGAGLVSFTLAVPITSRLGSYFSRPSVWAETVARESPSDLTVFGFAVLAAVLTGIGAGLVPALRSHRADLAGSLKAGSGDSIRPPHRLGTLKLPDVQDLLITTQVALSLVLLVVAGLVLRTFGAASDVHPGFAYEQVISSHISTSSTDLEPGERGELFE
ncbi:MAG: ABC transporter permease, partial [Longimicrobiales bacterium]